MDEAQRQQIVKMAAYAAAAGPVLLVLGKATKGVGALSTGIGKFATAVGKAGGGWKGLLSTLSRSPTVWLAIAAATVTATVAFADYISGAVSYTHLDVYKRQGPRQRYIDEVWPGVKP